ncbi:MULTISPECIES: hydroxyisourate hydrolase [Acinetobacter]|uniref:5-hydroxyisourate hydrolase n=1 Tax=Acinetobacter baylyi (strain ATCC 33305 / BD413 / ADP1) TaxID=62977 RepID=Q6F6Y4_ACIAD|nr:MULTISPECIES: hydroxyisourate hydrolase [Acinetobacter]ENV55281.1 hydroxyisourate hydrolase [Acinetobacter baylyi DSM 14961 = CIP 107474]KAF2370996.1 hydroxyisourate hydrolase [Acinetobacter baylyi]KAF2374794.1 hydroxyisourate hydrolase [Acinetobacter baylyi]KAF2379009.1 hydroxyisourate hydrolase [Acinetobacter baylyi]KAF2381928.1 hydroxyisourate hydrolase [Acinetobacter baylyi]
MISTHILDTHLGKPATQVDVRLYNAKTRDLIGQGVTDQDGRIKNFGREDLEAGAYLLEYDVAPYFSQKQLKTFFPQVLIQFAIENPAEHYHVPLLISPFAYSTYRGS